MSDQGSPQVTRKREKKPWEAYRRSIIFSDSTTYFTIFAAQRPKREICWYSIRTSSFSVPLAALAYLLKQPKTEYLFTLIASGHLGKLQIQRKKDRPLKWRASNILQDPGKAFFVSLSSASFEHWPGGVEKPVVLTGIARQRSQGLQTLVKAFFVSLNVTWANLSLKKATAPVLLQRSFFVQLGDTWKVA